MTLIFNSPAQPTIGQVITGLAVTGAGVLTAAASSLQTAINISAAGVVTVGATWSVTASLKPGIARSDGGDVLIGSAGLVL